MKTARNKKTGKLVTQYPHWVWGEFIYLPINDQWEWVDCNDCTDERAGAGDQRSTKR